MLTRFSGVYNIDNNNELNLYISCREAEKENINKIIDYAIEQPDAQGHIEFLERYQHVIQEHISTFRNAIKTAKELSTMLDTFLNDLDIESSLGNMDMFKIDSIQFYVSYNRGTFSFMTSIVDDSYLKKTIYASFDYEYNGKQLVSTDRHISFTNQPLEEIRSHPSYLLEEINKMDEEIYFEDVNARYLKCERLLFGLLNINELSDLLDIKDPYVNCFFGDPIDLIRKMNFKRTNNVIKLQLRNKIAYELTDNLISLIKTEITLKANHQKYDENNIYFGFKDVYDSETKRLTNEKKSLLEIVGIDQVELDRLMSFINLDKKPYDRTI